MTTPTVTETVRNGNLVTGRRVELARYMLTDGAGRVLYGQRVNRVVRVTDSRQVIPTVKGSDAEY
jgi:hypothetical protein